MTYDGVPPTARIDGTDPQVPVGDVCWVCGAGQVQSVLLPLVGRGLLQWHCPDCDVSWTSHGARTA